MMMVATTLLAEVAVLDLLHSSNIVTVSESRISMTKGLLRNFKNGKMTAVHFAG